MAICTGTAAIYMNIENSHRRDVGSEYILLICLLGYVCFGSFGFMVIPWTLIGELFPTEVIRNGIFNV